MLIESLGSNPQFYFAVVFVVIVSICLHELAHGFAAIALGDNTPEERGHITMNPLVHMGPIALIMLAVIGISWGAMPVDRTRLRGRYAEAIVAAAGPATNLVLALIGMTILGLWYRFGTVDTSNHMVDNATMLLRVMGMFNLVLFALNLMPVPPLDGSRILGNFVPAYERWIEDPTMQGVFFAVTIGVLLVAGRVLFPMAATVMTEYVALIAG